jgi:hypothetical protein
MFCYVTKSQSAKVNLDLGFPTSLEINKFYRIINDYDHFMLHAY